MFLVELNSKSTIAFTSNFNEMPRSLIGRKVNSHYNYCHLSSPIYYDFPLLLVYNGGHLVKLFDAYHCQQQFKLKCKKNTRFSLSHVHWSQNLEEKEKGSPAGSIMRNMQNGEKI